MNKTQTRMIWPARLAFGCSLLAAAFAPTHGFMAGAQQPATSATATPYIWRNVEIVGGGFVTGILFHPKEPNLIYVRTDIGGAYRWNSTTKRWIPLLDWLPGRDWNLYGIESVGLDPTDANRLYLATGTYTNSWAGNGAMLRSADQGRTWQRTDLPYKLGGNEDGRSIGERLAVDPDRNSILYFGSRHNGLWTSDDYAATWHQVESFPVTGRTNGIGIGFVLFDTRHGSHGKPTQTLYVGVAAPGDNLYRSTDGGAHWQAVAGQPQGLLPHHGVLAEDGTLYLSYGNGPGPNGMSDGAVWKLDTKTGAWTNITPIAPGGGGMGNFGYAGLTVDATHPGTVMVATMDKWSTGDDVYRSTDGGAHWTGLKAKSVRDSSASPFLNWGAQSAAFGHWIGALAVDPFHPGHVLYGTGATIWGSDDVTAADQAQTTHWTVRAQGLEETAVIDLISPPQGAHLLSALGDIGGFRHDDLAVAPRSGMYANPLLSNTDSLDYAEHDPALVARVGRGDARQQQGALSTDGGTTWTPFATNPSGRHSAGSVALAADGHKLLWAPEGNTAYATADRGATWQSCAGLPQDVRVVADRVDPHRFYAIENRGGRIYLSADDGATFSAGAQGLPQEHGALRATPGVAGDLWLPGNTGLYHSTDGGKTFMKLASVQQAKTMGFGKAAPGRTYPTLFLLGQIDGAEGIFRSNDAGATWVHLDDPAHQFATRNTIIGDPRIYGRIYLGTNGRGIFYGDPADEKAKTARKSL